MRRLSSAERRQRWSGEFLSKARKAGRYERSASVEELIADLAVLRAYWVASAARRRLCGGLMAVFAVIGLGILPIAKEGGVPISVACAVLFVFVTLTRVLTNPHQVARLDGASELLRSLEVPAGVAVRLALSLRKVQRAEHAVPGSRTLGQLYRLEAVTVSAPGLELQRFDECDFRQYLTLEGGRRLQVREWVYSYEDQVRVALGAQTEVRAALGAVEVLSLASDRLVVRTLLTPVEVLGRLVRLRAQPIEGAMASVSRVPARAIGVFALLLSVPFTAAAWDHYRWFPAEPFFWRAGAQEALILGGVALFLWVIALVTVRRV